MSRNCSLEYNRVFFGGTKKTAWKRRVDRRIEQAFGRTWKLVGIRTRAITPTLNVDWRSESTWLTLYANDGGSFDAFNAKLSCFPRSAFNPLSFVGKEWMLTNANRSVFGSQTNWKLQCLAVVFSHLCNSSSLHDEPHWWTFFFSIESI